MYTKNCNLENYGSDLPQIVDCSEGLFSRIDGVIIKTNIDDSQ